jgi:hypothetical protein
MVYPVISENIPSKSRLTERGGAPPRVAIKNAKSALSEKSKKMILI